MAGDVAGLGIKASVLRPQPRQGHGQLVGDGRLDMYIDNIHMLLALLLLQNSMIFCLLTLPPLWHQRHEDVVHAGNLDDDTAEPEQPEFDASATGHLVEHDRMLAKSASRTKALMQRFGGHPYENFDMIPAQVCRARKYWC